MQSAIDSIIQQLQNLLENAKNLQSYYLGDVLALEKLINHTQKCIQTIIPKETIKELPKKQAPPLSVQDKVEALMTEIETRQRIIEQQTSKPKAKFEVKLPEIPVEKKPPVPTANRSEKAVKNLNPAYVPPRNKNEVTGKVTQTTMRTSAQKIFRPQKTSIKKVESKEQIRSSKGNTREKSSVQKRQSKPEPVVKKNEPMSRNEVKMAQPSIQTKEQKDHQQNNTRKNVQDTKKGLTIIKFASFHKQIDQIFSQLFKNGPRNHKSQLQKLLIQCQNQQKGHKMHEDNNRKIFIKKANNYAVSRHAVYPMSSYQITRNKWTYHSQLADFNLLLDSIENQLANLELQKDCRIDKKTHFRIAQSSLIYGKTLEVIKDDFQQSQHQVPEKIQFDFGFNSQQGEGGNNDEGQWEQVSESALSFKLLQLLEDIGQRGTLEKHQLRGLQTLSEIGMFRSKRTPLIVMQDEYRTWKSYYAPSNS